MEVYPDIFQENRDILLELAKIDPKVIDYIPYHIRSEPLFHLELVIHYSNMGHIPRELR